MIFWKVPLPDWRIKTDLGVCMPECFFFSFNNQIENCFLLRIAMFHYLLFIFWTYYVMLKSITFLSMVYDMGWTCFSIRFYLSLSCANVSYFSLADAYPNMERSYIGDNIEFEVSHVSIWHCIQTPSHWKGYITRGMFFFLNKSFYV